jgi:hypothetical protein
MLPRVTERAQFIAGRIIADGAAVAAKQFVG